MTPPHARRPSSTPSRLDARLAAVARFVPEGARVAEVGADHGLLCLALAATGRRCVGIELRPGPLARLRANIERSGLADRVEARLGDGLAPIAAGEVDVVCAAGLGGPTIAAVLVRGGEALRSVQRLVLQPLASARRLRQVLIDLDFGVVHEELVEESGRCYELIVADRGDPLAAYRASALPRAIALRIGPLLGSSEDTRLTALWRDRLGRVRAQLDGIPPGHAEARGRLGQEAAEIEAWLAGRTDPPSTSRGAPCV